MIILVPRSPWLGGFFISLKLIINKTTTLSVSHFNNPSFLFLKASNNTFAFKGNVTVKHLPDNWATLRQHHISRTIAKIGSGSGNHLPNLPNKHLFNILWENVYESVNFQKLKADLEIAGWEGYELYSNAYAKYDLLSNPNLGKQLQASSIASLHSLQAKPADIALVVTDYLNAKAVHNHGINLLQTFRKKLEPKGITFAPITLVQHGNGAIGASIGKLLNARFSLTIYGDKPFLYSNNSISAQLIANHPTNDETILKYSQINNLGVSYHAAANELITAFIKAAKNRQ